MPVSRKLPLKRRLNPLENAMAVVILIATLYFAQEVLIPIALSVLLTFLLTPLVNRLQRWGLPSIPAVLVATAIAFGVILGVGGVVGGQVYGLAENIPKYKQNISDKYDRATAFFGKFGSGFEKFGSDIARTAGHAEKAVARPGPDALGTPPKPVEGTDNARPARQGGAHAGRRPRGRFGRRPRHAAGAAGRVVGQPVLRHRPAEP